MEILQIQNLSFCYPNTHSPALKNIQLSINSGDFTVILGKSGCGKSTLLKLIKKEISPFGDRKGRIIFKGKDMEDISDRVSASCIGMVQQNPYSQTVTDTVWHELAFGAESLGLNEEIIRRRVAETASYFGIQSWFRKNTSQLSGGQLQILNLASVMVMQPEILLLDEPTSQLDPITAADFTGTLRKLNRELGLTIVLVEHRLEEILPICDRAVLMDNGEILYNGKPENINEYFKNHPNDNMSVGLPSAMRIFNGLDFSGESPLTVRDGRKFIEENFGNKIKELDFNNKKNESGVCVSLKDVYFRYSKNSNDIIRGINLKIRQGEHFAILGGNGAGKTTLLGIISGSLNFYKGKVKIFDKSIKEYKGNSLYLKNIAYLPQNQENVFIKSTVSDDFNDLCERLNYTKEQAKSKISDICNLLNISDLIFKHPYDLSGGEQQKAALAKILLSDPKILLLDEPTKGVDPYSKSLLGKTLKALKKRGITIITVTHDVEFAAVNADRCGMIFDGEIISEEEPRKFFAGNNFYTTAANRISRGYYKKTILVDDVIKLCKINGRMNKIES